MNTPDTFRAGDSVSWSEFLPDYLPADGWVLKFRLLWPSGVKEFEAVGSGTEHAVNLASTSTADWQAGTATLLRYVEKAGHKVTLSSSSVTVLPDLTAATGHDGRSMNRRALDAAEAALLAYLQGGKACVAEYEIAGRKMKFRDVSQIRELIAHYKVLVARENTAMAMLQGGHPPGRIFYRG